MKIVYKIISLHKLESKEKWPVIGLGQICWNIEELMALSVLYTLHLKNEEKKKKVINLIETLDRQGLN